MDFSIITQLFDASTIMAWLFKMSFIFDLPVVGQILWVVMVWFILLPYSLWVFFLAAMNLLRAKDEGKITKVASIAAIPVIGIGFLIDFICNMIPATIIFMDLPREKLVTERLKRYKYGPDGFRKRWTLWFAPNMLDEFDPEGPHV